jgi:hypothetical protein
VNEAFGDKFRETVEALDAGANATPASLLALAQAWAWVQFPRHVHAGSVAPKV